MFFVAGTNFFNQWVTDTKVIPEFKSIAINDSSINFSAANLIQVNWSYNIFEINGDFYIVGAWDGSKLITKIKLPSEIKSSPMLYGNDHKLIVTSKDGYTAYISDIGSEKFKKINLRIEQPSKDSSKKQRLEENIKKISLNNEACLYLTANGHVYCGLLPTYVDTSHCIGNVCDIDCGYEHYMLVTDQGNVYTWGNGRRLQLGHGDVLNLDTPTEVKGLAGIRITKIAAGGWHSLALSEFGDLYAWGWNDTGQLGVKRSDLKSHSSPTLVDLYDDDDENNLNIKDIACGSRHSAILLDNNTVWTTGYNKYGQLGFPPEKQANLQQFTQVCRFQKDTKVTCGPWTTVVSCK